MEGCIRNRYPAGAELLGTGENRGPLEKIPCDLHGGPIFRCHQEGTFHPGIECPHGRSTPDLEIECALIIARDGPARGLAQVPPKNQRHSVLGIFFRPSILIGISGLEEFVGGSPDVFDGVEEEILLEVGPIAFGDCFERWVCPIEFVKFLGTAGKEGASSEYLDFYAHLKHIGGWRHHHVAERGGRELLFAGK